MASLSRRWFLSLQDMGTRSGLMSEALQSANPNLHLVRVLKKYAPLTLVPLFCRMGPVVCALPCRLLPDSPPSGVLPDWLASRVSSQGLATGPVLVASTPSERRESLPLPLSFVAWLEKLVCLPSTPPAEVHFAGTVLSCIWSALRCGDALWVPPSRLIVLPDQSAVVGVALRT